MKAADESDNNTSNALATESRLDLLASLSDRSTITFLSDLQLARTAHVAEIGSGSGITAALIAQNLVPEGTVDAVDLSQPSGAECPSNVNQIQTDIRLYVPAVEPDLVHARYVFGHLADRDEQISKFTTYLRCGGHFVITEPVKCEIPSRAPRAIQEVFTLYNDWVHSAGMALDFAPQIPALFASCGLTQIGCSIRESWFGGGSGSDVWSELIRSVETPLLDWGANPEDLEEFHRLARIDSELWIPQTIWTVHGVKPRVC